MSQYDIVYDIVGASGKNSPKTYDIVGKTYDIVVFDDIVYDIVGPDIRCRIIQYRRQGGYDIVGVI